MSRLDAMFDAAAIVLVHWTYPAYRPALLPFVVRRTITNMVLPVLWRGYKLSKWLARGIGVVHPDEAKRNGIKGVD